MTAPEAAPRSPAPIIVTPVIIPPANAPSPVVKPPRPAGITVAAYLLSGTSAFWLAAAIATLFAIPQYRRHYGDLTQNADVALLTGLLLSAVVVLAVLAGGVALLLALLDADGRPAARVLTWVLGGMSVGVAGLILLLDPFEVVSWHQWLTDGVATLTIGFMLATGVLLALPASGTYVRGVRGFHAARRAAIRLARPPVHPRVPAYPRVPPGYPSVPGQPPASSPQPMPRPGPPPGPQLPPPPASRPSVSPPDGPAPASADPADDRP